MFDNMAFMAAQGARVDSDELKQYLAADLEGVDNLIEWWQGRRQKYPRLSRMALDYLNIPATSVEVERVFSRGRLLLSHVRNRLTAESTRASMCLGVWSKHGLVDSKDLYDAARMPALDEPAPRA